MSWNPGSGGGGAASTIGGKPVANPTGSLFYVLGFDGTQWLAGPGGARGFHVKAYGAKGDGVTDDTAAINAAVAAWLAAGEGVLIFEDVTRTDYVLSGPVTVNPPGNQTYPLAMTGYGAKLRLTTATAGVVCYQSTGSSWRGFLIQGLTAVLDSNLTTDAFLFTDNGHSGSFWGWEAKDLHVEVGNASAPICNGIHCVQTSGANVVFQFKITNPFILMTQNTTGACIKIASANAGFSSVEVSNPNTYGGAFGIVIGQSGHPVSGVRINKGTVNGSAQQLILMYTQGGVIDQTHVEGAWTGGAGTGEQIYVEGSCHCLWIDSHRNTISANETNVIRIFSTVLPSIIEGMGNVVNAVGPWLKILGAGGVYTGTVKTIAIPASEVDWSAVGSTSGPTLDLWSPKFTAFPVYGANVNIDASQGDIQSIVCTNSTAFTVNNPTNYVPGQLLTIIVTAPGTGAAGAVTFGNNFHLAGGAASFTPPSAANKNRSITFINRGIYPAGVYWEEVSRLTVDV